MKENSFFCGVHALFFVASIFLPTTVFALDRVDAFVGHIQINNDGSAFVQEEIVYNFVDKPQHGILREIPLIFPSVDTYSETNADISSITVSDGKGHPLQTSFDKGGNVVTLKIGDIDTVVSGSQLYVIRYTLWGAVNPILLNDVFYWDVTGHSWKVPIGRVRVDVVLPKPMQGDMFSYTCFVGEIREKSACQSASVFAYATSGQASTIRFEHDGLSRYEGLAVKIQMPKGSIFYANSKKDGAHSSVNKRAGIVKWWTQPFIDTSLAFPFLVFAGLYSFFLSQKETRKLVKEYKKKKLMAKKKTKEHIALTLRETYILSGILIAGLSFLIPSLNLGVFTSGVVIFCFAWLYPRRES